MDVYTKLDDMDARKLILVLAIIVLGAPSVIATTTVIDNFEDGDFTTNPVWTSIETAGGTQSVQSSIAFNGADALLLTTDGAEDAEYNRLETALDNSLNYTGAETITTYMRAADVGNSQRGVRLITSTNDEIYVEFDGGGAGGDNISINYQNQASTYEGQSYNQDVWYAIEFIVNENTNQATINVVESNTIIHTATDSFTGTITNLQVYSRDTGNQVTNTYYDYVTYSDGTGDLQNIKFNFHSVSASGEDDSGNTAYFTFQDQSLGSGSSEGPSGESLYFQTQQVGTESYEITNVVATGVLFPQESDAVEAYVNFTITATEGFTGESYDAYFDNGVQNNSITCDESIVSSTQREYNCTSTFQYYHPADDYDLTIKYTNNAETLTYFDANVLTYGQLVASKRLGDSLSFTNAGPGKINVRSDQQIGFENTGNAPIDVTITAYNLQSRSDPSQVIDADQFLSGNASVTTAQSLQNNQPITIVQELAPGNAAAANLWFWLSMDASLPPADYYAPVSWQIQGVVS